MLGGVAAVAASGAFAVTQLGGGDGAGSPEAAVQAMFGALGDEDLLGVLEALAPGERRALRPTVETLADELQRLGVLGDGVALDDISGIDITIEGLELESDEVADGIAAVTVTGGAIAVESVPDDLPIGDNLRSLIEEGGGEVGEAEYRDEGDLGDERIDIMAVEDDGGWHVSLFYTLAEAVRRGSGLDVPDFAAGVEPEGADSAEAAVEGMLRSAVGLDLEAVIAGLAPDEAGALQDYAPLFLPDVEAGAADLRESGVELALDELELSSEGADDGATRVTLDAFRLSVGIPDEGEMVVEFDGECVRFEVDGQDASLDFLGTGEDEFCLDDEAGAGLFGSLSGATGGFVTVEVGGSHFVSPTRTAFDGVLQFVAALQPEDLEDSEALFALLYGDLLSGAESDFEDFDDFDDLDDLDDLDDAPNVMLGDPVPPVDFGDEPEYQTLAEDCFAGDFGACDDLYFASPIGSDYETYARTCGGRLTEAEAVDGGCAALLDDPAAPGGGDRPADEPLEPQAPPTPSDPAFQSLVDSCFAGDMQACDDAYYESGVGTPEEAYGLSCGGRRSEADSFDDCVERFGPAVVD